MSLPRAPSFVSSATAATASLAGRHRPRGRALPSVVVPLLDVVGLSRLPARRGPDAARRRNRRLRGCGPLGSRRPGWHLATGASEDERPVDRGHRRPTPRCPPPRAAAPRRRSPASASSARCCASTAASSWSLRPDTWCGACCRRSRRYGPCLVWRRWPAAADRAERRQGRRRGLRARRGGEEGGGGDGRHLPHHSRTHSLHYRVARWPSGTGVELVEAGEGATTSRRSPRWVVMTNRSTPRSATSARSQRRASLALSSRPASRPAGCCSSASR